MKRTHSSQFVRAAILGTRLAIGAALAGLPACSQVERFLTPAPREVEGLNVRAVGDQLVVEWSNPRTFENVELEVIGPAGEMVAVPGGPERRAARAREGSRVELVPLESKITEAAPSGGDASGRSYRVVVRSYVSPDPSAGAAEVAAECKAPLPPEEPYFRLTGGQAGPMPDRLRVVYVVHPDCPFGVNQTVATEKSLERSHVFRQVATIVLSQVFASACELRLDAGAPDRAAEHAEAFIGGIEANRHEVLSRSAVAPSPLIDPHAVVVVDYRRGSAARDHLSIRLVDLELFRLLGVNADATELKNKRPLIVEAYQEVDPVDESVAHSLSSLTRSLRKAWSGLVSEVRENSRYVAYRDGVLALQTKDTADPELKAFLKLLFFGLVAGDRRPYAGDSAIGETVEDRIRYIEENLLFGPDPDAWSVLHARPLPADVTAPERVPTGIVPAGTGSLPPGQATAIDPATGREAGGPEDDGGTGAAPERGEPDAGADERARGNREDPH